MVESGGKVKVPSHLGYHSSLQSTKGNAKVCNTVTKYTQVAKIHIITLAYVAFL